MLEIDQQIEKKQKELNEIKDAKKGLIEAQLKNMQILRETVTVKEAHQIYKSGKITLKEYEEYAEKRKNLEYMVKIGMDFLEPDPIICRLESELKELEKSRRKENIKGFAKAIGIVLLAFLIGPVLLLCFGLNKLGILPIEFFPYIMFTALGANIVIGVWLYVYGKKK